MKSMLKHFIIATILGFVGFFGYLAIYLGAFKTVELSEGDSGPFYILYVDHIGPYHKIVEKIQTVEVWAKNLPIGCRFSFGQYFDDPSKVDSDRLRSRGGCLYDSPLPANLNLPIQNNNQEFKIATIERQFYLQAHFDGSPSIGPFKVYPKLEAKLKAMNLKDGEYVIERYEVKDSKTVNTHYFMPRGF
jgi:AraC family transcriptional regulator